MLQFVFDNQQSLSAPHARSPTSSLKHRGAVDLSGYQSRVCLPAFAVSVWWVHVRGLSSEDGAGQTTATGIKNRGRDYFKCQHNVMSCVRRSNVQTVLSGEQLIDQVQFGLLWLLWWIDWRAKTSLFFFFFFGDVFVCYSMLDVLCSLKCSNC